MYWNANASTHCPFTLCRSTFDSKRSSDRPPRIRSAKAAMTSRLNWLLHHTVEPSRVVVGVSVGQLGQVVAVTPLGVAPAGEHLALQLADAPGQTGLHLEVDREVFTAGVAVAVLAAEDGVTTVRRPVNLDQPAVELGPPEYPLVALLVGRHGLAGPEHVPPDPLALLPALLVEVLADLLAQLADGMGLGFALSKRLFRPVQH